MLVVKQSLQFLYAFLHSLLKQCGMVLFVGHTQKVLWSIVRPHPIKVVDNPSFRERPTLSFLPDKNMLTDITPISSWMVGSIEKDISCSFMPTTLPAWMLIPYFSGLYYAIVFRSTYFTAFGLSGYFYFAVYTVIYWCLFPSTSVVSPAVNKRTWLTSKTSITTGYTTVKTRMLALFSVSPYLFGVHKYSIPLYIQKVKL